MKNLFITCAAISTLLVTSACVKVNPRSGAFIPTYGKDIQLVADNKTEIEFITNINDRYVKNIMTTPVLSRLQQNMERVSDRRSDTVYHISRVHINVERSMSEPWLRTLLGVISVVPVLSPIPDGIRFNYEAEYAIADDTGRELLQSTVKISNRASYSGWTFFRFKFSKRAGTLAMINAANQIADTIANDAVSKQHLYTPDRITSTGTP